MSVGFAGVFAPLAVQLAFLPVWFEHVGFTSGQIGLLLGLPLLVRVLTTPPLLALADRVPDRKAYFAACAAAAFATSIGYFAFASFGPLLIVTILVAVATAVAIPLADAIALSGVRRLAVEYGTMRLWGSVAFVAITLGVGWVVERTGVGFVPFAVAGTLLVTLGCGLYLPSAPRLEGHRPATELLGDRTLLLALAAGAMANAAHALFYGFSSIHWTGLGFSATTIGLLWGLGVAAEVALFALAVPLLPGVRPLQLVAVGCAVGIVRWAMFTVDGGVVWFASNALLHGATFGAVLLGVQRLIAERVDDARQGSAQALASAMMAPATAVVTLVSGWLYGALGGDAFWIMAAFAAAGLSLVLLAFQPQSAGEGGETSDPE